MDGITLMRSGLVGRGDLSLLHTVVPFARLPSAPPNRKDRVSFPPVLALALRRFGRAGQPPRSEGAPPSLSRPTPLAALRTRRPNRVP